VEDKLALWIKYEFSNINKNEIEKLLEFVNTDNFKALHPIYDESEDSVVLTLEYGDIFGEVATMDNDTYLVLTGPFVLHFNKDANEGGLQIEELHSGQVFEIGQGCGGGA
jgi:hypothetical protein